MPIALMYTVNVLTASITGTQTLIEYERASSQEEAQEIQRRYQHLFPYPYYLVTITRDA